MELCSAGEVRALLEEYGLSPRKAFGQNFLTDPSVPERIADAAAATVRGGPTAALEIGPGIGALTACLAERFDRVVAVEIDRGLIPVLGRTLGEYGNVEIIEGDFLSIDLVAFFREKLAGYSVAVCANLPYYITTPIMMRFFDTFSAARPMPVSSLTFMVQLEVAQRICSTNDAGDYGAVAASVALSAGARRLFSVPPGCFYPAPSVTSAVMQLIPHENAVYSVYPDAPANAAECERFVAETRRLISAAFAKRRKTLVNALSDHYPKDLIASVIADLGLRPDIRGEKLSVSDFCRLADGLKATPHNSRKEP